MEPDPEIAKHVNRERPAMCIKHGDFHLLGDDCADALVGWFFGHYDPGAIPAMRQDYQAAVEAKMLERVMADECS